jgi:hypothetical protein
MLDRTLDLSVSIHEFCDRIGMILVGRSELTKCVRPLFPN